MNKKGFIPLVMILSTIFTIVASASLGYKMLVIPATIGVQDDTDTLEWAFNSTVHSFDFGTVHVSDLFGAWSDSMNFTVANIQHSSHHLNITTTLTDSKLHVHFYTDEEYTTEFVQGTIVNVGEPINLWVRVRVDAGHSDNPEISFHVNVLTPDP